MANRKGTLQGASYRDTQSIRNLASNGCGGYFFIYEWMLGVGWTGWNTWPAI